MEEMRQAGENPEEFAPSRREAKEVRHDFSRFLDDFRTGREPQTTQWIRLASLVASQSFSCDIVIRALRPNEKSTSGKTPLDKLGESLARKIGAKYSPGRLKRDTSSPETMIFDPDHPGRADRFLFDASSFKPDVRVLVVGDLETPAETYAEIVRAIKAVSPTATVKSFSLQWLEDHFRSTPFDDDYFLTSASPLSVLSKGGDQTKSEGEKNPPTAKPGSLSTKAKTAARMPSAVVAPAEPAATIMLPAETQIALASLAPVVPAPVVPAPVVPAPVVPGPVVLASVVPTPIVSISEPPAPAIPGSTARHADRRKPRPAIQDVRRPATTPAWTAIALIAILVVGVGVVVFAKVFSPNQESSLTERFVPEGTLNNHDVSTAISAVAPPAVVAERERGPKGIVTVPTAGLRSGPSLDARPAAGNVKSNERVTILKRRVSSNGPDWVQVETKSGNVGWVWASVVREIRR